MQFLDKLKIPNITKVVCMDMLPLDPRCHVGDPNAEPRMLPYPFEFHQLEMCRGNYIEFLEKHCEKGDILIELINEIKTIDLIKFCIEREIHFINTACYAWPEEGHDNMIYGQVLDVFNWHKENDTKGKATCCTMYGANPGIVSHYMMRAMRDLWKRIFPAEDYPLSDTIAAQKMGVYSVDITEDDQQVSKPGWVGDYENKFYCSWCPYAFYYENTSFSEVMTKHGTLVQTRTDENNKDIWGASFTPFSTERHQQLNCGREHKGVYIGNVVQQEEVETIGKHLWDKEADYCPVTRFIYKFCEPARISLEKTPNEENFLKKKCQILGTEIDGDDVIGVIVRTKTHAQWVGSAIPSEFAREFIPTLNASDWYPALGVFTALKYVTEFPNEGLKLPEEIPLDWAQKTFQQWMPEIVSVECDGDSKKEDLGFPFNGDGELKQELKNLCRTD